MNRKEEIRNRFEDIFGITYEAGIVRLKVLMRRTVTFSRFIPFNGSSSLTVNELDFGIIAFFACLGAGYLEEIGLPELPPKSSDTIDAEYEEV